MKEGEDDGGEVVEDAVEKGDGDARCCPPPLCVLCEGENQSLVQRLDGATRLAELTSGTSSRRRERMDGPETCVRCPFQYHRGTTTGYSRM